mmetsp:Transcript_13540/g.40835  ORF Transcript_13540/g.40835 Transcript_13540/m.40835 type:complete len:314 (+) Transcript_13540:191-1132(+)
MQHHLRSVDGTGCEAKTLGAHRHSGEVDRLHVDAALLQQPVAHALAELSIADQHRQNVGRTTHQREATLQQQIAQSLSIATMLLALHLALLEVAYTGESSSSHHGRQRSGERVARAVVSHRIQQIRLTAHVATVDAERLAQCAADQIETRLETELLRHTTASLAVQTDRVHLVHKGERVVALCQIADGFDRRHGAVHRVHGFEQDDFGDMARCLLKQLLEVGQVVVAEHVLGCPALAHSLDDAGVVLLVREELAARKQFHQRLDGGAVGNVARTVEHGTLLAVQRGQLRLELHVEGGGTRYVTRATASGAVRL